ncbi:MAG: Uma2 family endonuclease [Polyangiaceae bacterium]
MSAAEKVHRATLADLLAIPEDKRDHEIINGELVKRASPSFDHGDAQMMLGSDVIRIYGRRPEGKGPGGWWIVADVEILLEENEIYRPDLVGWRRDRVPTRPKMWPVDVRPDWVCEILSPSNARNDTIRKMRVYHRAGVPHYWIADPQEQTLTVYRHSPDGYTVLLIAERGDRVRPEPFTELELDLAALFGDPDE